MYSEMGFSHWGGCREDKRKSSCPDGQITYRTRGQPPSWSMMGVFSTATWHKDHAWSSVNYYRQRNSTSLPSLTTNGWEQVGRTCPTLGVGWSKWYKCVLLNQVAGVPSTQLRVLLLFNQHWRGLLTQVPRTLPSVGESWPWFCSWAAVCLFY